MSAPDASFPARYAHMTESGKLACDLCPRDCLLADGQRGMCFVRKREGSQMVLTTYGRSSGVALDPIEKKPLNHFYPGSSVLSFGTAGCNLACSFCQNWEISKSREMDSLSEEASPDAIARAAKAAGARSVAFTYNDPIVFAEYAMDTADACHALGIATVAVTAGYVHPEPRADFFAKMDAANVDLKAFTEAFYAKYTASRLAPVKETLVYLAKHTPVWLELTTLVIPGLNDSDAELTALAAWVAKELGEDVPLHFTAFHPDHRMRDVSATPLSTLRRARAIAQREGLRYVYTGNVYDPEGDTTSCPSCGEAVIERDRYEIVSTRLSGGACGSCGARIAGHFGAKAEAFGRRRVRLVALR
ncbi:MAG: AmmeMemoRadiSam system radical SAM enzyme [Polyangiaceae bacterium]